MKKVNLTVHMSYETTDAEDDFSKLSMLNKKFDEMFKQTFPSAKTHVNHISKEPVEKRTKR